MGNVTDFSNFLGPVIDERAFNRHLGYLDIAAPRRGPHRWKADEARVVCQPTRSIDDPHADARRNLRPHCLRVVYDDAKWTETIAMVDQTSHTHSLAPSFLRTATPSMRPCRPQAVSELLHKRQANRRSRRPAALRWCASLRHQRQGRKYLESSAMGLAKDDQETFAPHTTGPTLPGLIQDLDSLISRYTGVEQEVGPCPLHSPGAPKSFDEGTPFNGDCSF